MLGSSERLSPPFHVHLLAQATSLTSTTLFIHLNNPNF